MEYIIQINFLPISIVWHMIYAPSVDPNQRHHFQFYFRSIDIWKGFWLLAKTKCLHFIVRNTCHLERNQNIGTLLLYYWYFYNSWKRNDIKYLNVNDMSVTIEEFVLCGIIHLKFKMGFWCSNLWRQWLHIKRS